MVEILVIAGWRGEDYIPLRPGLIDELIAEFNDPTVVDPLGPVAFLSLNRVHTNDEFLQTNGPGPFPDRPSYLFEYRDGEGRMYRSFLEGNELALALMSGYASDDPGWRDLVRWKRFKP